MSLSDESWRIDTPENVAFDYEVAGIGSRFLAAIVDTLLIVVLQAIVYATLLLMARVLAGGLDLADSFFVNWLVAILGLLAFLFLWGYYVLFEMLWNGQSPGKRWVGLRVIRTDGTPISFVESLVRNLVRLVDFMPGFYGVGLVTMFINAQARRLGDLAAGTIVVYDRPTVTLESLTARPVVSSPFLPASNVATDLPVERLSSQDIQIAEDFLRRRGGFADDLALSQRIAVMLLRKMAVPETQMAGVYPVNLIWTIVQAWRSRETGSSGQGASIGTGRGR
jgi:uncharacterized RDD family membrane protein YckC